MADPVDAVLQPCGQCQQHRKLVRPVPTSEGTVLVGKCLDCDTRTCSHCRHPVRNPYDHRCPNCRKVL